MPVRAKKPHQNRRLWLEKIFLNFFKKSVDKLALLVYNEIAVKRGGKKTWELSSAGRASALQAEGHRFEPCSSHHFNLKALAW